MNQNHPLGALLHTLGLRVDLSDEDCRSILALPHTLRTVSAGAYIIREGEPPSTCAVLVRGYAFRQKVSSSGKRTIVSIHLPGEPLDLQSLYLTKADHSAQALTHAQIATVGRPSMRELAQTRPMVGAAMMASNMVEASIYREWLLNVSRRNARERVAHLLCEFAHRVDAQGLGSGRGYTLPMTQEQLGDALGLTSVHVNRTLKALEADGLLTRTGRDIAFPAVSNLEALAEFDSLYLHTAA